jgi:hypothetical protein
LNDFSAENISFEIKKIQKSWFQNNEPLCFKDFSAENIPFKFASLKIGDFIRWDFTMAVLGDANGGLWHYVLFELFVSTIPYYGVVISLICILSCDDVGFLSLVQINVHFGLYAWRF